MHLPTYRSLIETFTNFAEREELTFMRALNPIRMWHIFMKYRFVHFFFTGGVGVLLNLSITWTLTEFYFGVNNYFEAYLIGLSFNILYNFALYTRLIFRTQRQHTARFFVFIIYNLTMSYFQAMLTKFITPIVGVEWYLLVIPTIILIFSFVSFLLYKLAIFKERN